MSGDYLPVYQNRPLIKGFYFKIAGGRVEARDDPVPYFAGMCLIHPDQSAWTQDDIHSGTLEPADRTFGGTCLMQQGGHAVLLTLTRQFVHCSVILPNIGFDGRLF
ncbi:MAG: hypothetical protein VB959_21285 [Rhodospirillales bacterium]